MLIRLKWLNNNDSTAIVQVFRSTATIDTANPGAAYATLPGDAITYDDTAVTAGVTYYYAVCASRGTKKFWTPVKTFLNEPVRGPGSSRIIYGDDRLGYMGKLSTVDFIDVSKILNLSVAATNAYAGITWHKFIRKGKIIYVADRVMCYPAYNVHAPAQRRLTGITSGLSWNFDTSAWPNSGKTFIVTKESDSFHLRTVRGLVDDWDGSAITDAMIQHPETEFNELIIPILGGEFYLPNKIGSVRTGVQVTGQTFGPIACAEMYLSGSEPATLTRLMYDAATGTPTTQWNFPSSYTRSATAFFKWVLRSFAVNGAGQTSAVPNQSASFWPVFELID